MKKAFHAVIALLTALVLLFGEAQAQESVKLAQTGMQFLSVVSDARAAALANAVTTLPFGSASLFFNPACMTEGNFVEVAASSNQWIADIKHYTFSASVSPSDGDFGVFGLSVQGVDYGEILGTVIADNDQGYEDIQGELDVFGLAVGIGYAKALSEQFSIGGQVRWVRQSLGESTIPLTDSTTQRTKNRLNPLVFDFGTNFRTGLKSLTFGMSVRNFSTEVKYVSESFELPLTITLGLSMDMMDLLGDRSAVSSLLLSVDYVHNRDYREQVFVGTECLLLDVLALRAGYISNSDEADFTFGFGLSAEKYIGYVFDVDYAYTPFGVFDKVQRFTVRFGM